MSSTLHRGEILAVATTLRTNEVIVCVYMYIRGIHIHVYYAESCEYHVTSSPLSS